MEDIKKDFVKVGCDKYLFDLEKIIVCGKDEKVEAAQKAKHILVDFDSLIAKIEGAKREKQPEEIPGILNADKAPVEYYETQLLHKALKLLEHEESTRKIRILAVDDAPIILKTISSVLGEEYKVYGMTDPTTLEKFLKQITPELFLLDYKMPSLSGFDLIPIIRSFEAHKDTPIIFLTSEGKADNVSTALKLGACDYIVKPFQGKQLREKIAKHLGKKKQQ
jgi:CheY-like chemotaxis protein